MELFLTFATLFLTGGVGGWIIELFFRRFVSQKKWVNPGFLTGPFLPLYGFGLCGFYLFSNLIPWANISSNSGLNLFLEILSMGLAMTLIEYLAGLIFIKGMKIKLWDYSARWGNVQGIICPLFSLLWTVVGVIYLMGVNPVFVSEVAFVLQNETLFALLWGVAFGIMLVDLGWSVGLVTRIRKAVHDRTMVVDWDKIKLSFQEHYRKAHETPEWIFAFKTKKEEFSALMNEYVATLQQEAALRSQAYNLRQERKRAKQLARLEKRLGKKNEKEDEEAKKKENP
jgi:uncharacterized membrane protein